MISTDPLAADPGPFSQGPEPRARRWRGWFGWLGLGRAAADEPPAPLDAADARDAACRQVAHEIGDFLATLHLPMTQLSLSVALDCVSGNDRALAALIDERRASGEPVTMDWLVEVRRAAQSEDEMRAMSRLMDRLEGSLEDFGRTTHAVRTVASDYGKALRSHVEDIDGSGALAGDAGAGPAALAGVVALTRAMIERTHAMEQRIARSERETKSLRRKLDETRRDAELDHLTGLPNRRAFETRFEREVVSARAAGEPLCVAFCDIDRFKKINDSHGHDAGDRVLKVVAHGLNEISDDRCHVARHGGEEFVVLLRGRTLPEAYRLLDEAREQLADRRMVNRATEVPFGKVTFSAGLANVMAYSDPRAALRAADAALYAAKASGRNRIHLAPDPGGDGTTGVGAKAFNPHAPIPLRKARRAA